MVLKHRKEHKFHVSKLIMMPKLIEMWWIHNCTIGSIGLQWQQYRDIVGDKYILSLCSEC